MYPGILSIAGSPGISHVSQDTMYCGIRYSGMVWDSWAMYPGILSIAGSDILAWYGTPGDFLCILGY